MEYHLLILILLILLLKLMLKYFISYLYIPDTNIQYPYIQE